MFFGGEGIFNTRIIGPGKVYIQSMPVINTANVLSLYLPNNSDSDDSGIKLNLGDFNFGNHVFYALGLLGELFYDKQKVIIKTPTTRLAFYLWFLFAYQNIISSNILPHFATIGIKISRYVVAVSRALVAK